jgi:WD40 repeat protein
MFSKQIWSYLAAWLAFLVIPLSSFDEQKSDSFSLPDSVLLFAKPYYDVRVVTPDQSLVIRPPVDVPANSGLFNYPSISRKGDLIAWGFAVQGHPRATRFALGVYAISEQRWKTYGDFDDIGATAFSPDGSKIAFVADEPERRDAFLIFDVATGKMTNVPHPKGIRERATISWSPDGKRLVVEIQRSEKSTLIVVLDPSTGDSHPIGEGSDPAWSPTGEWIAYYDLSGKKCMVVHPDGTGTKVAKHGGGSFFIHREFGWGLVWSPDGKKLLLNEMKGDLRYINIDVVLLDLETGRSTTKSKNGLPVFGWASQ